MKYWERCNAFPGGRFLFSRVIGRLIPYSGSIGFQVESLQRGRATVTLKDRRRVRNHLNSIHAMALANLGEVVTGLSVLSAAPQNTRGILLRFEIDYPHKARGQLTADCDVLEQKSLLEGVEGYPTDITATGYIRDSEDRVVAVVSSTWRIDNAPAQGA